MKHLSNLPRYLLFITIINNTWADTSIDKFIQPLATTNEPGNRIWAGTIDTQGHTWLGIYPNRQNLFLYNQTSNKIPITIDRKASPTGLTLTAADVDRVWIAYVNKLPERGIFVARSDAPQTLYKMSDDSLPLAKVLLKTDHQGGVYALWYDEKPATDNPEQIYWLWFNHLNQDGKIATPERILPGTYPLWIHSANDEKIAIFSWYNLANDGNYIVMKLRDISGKLGPEIKVAKVDYLSLPLGTFTAGNRWFVYWVAQYGRLKDDFLIEGAYSDDQGQTWQKFSLDTLRKLDVRNITTAADASGHIAIAVAGRYRQPKPGQRTKFSSYLITSNDNGNHWNKPLLLNPDSASYSQAPNVKAAYIGTETNQHLLVTVEDWRNIRSQIRYWISANNGETWQIQDRLLPLDPTFNYQLGYYDQSIYSYQDKVSILIERLGDELMNRTIINFTAPIQDLINISNITESIPNEETLKARVNAYGQTLINKDYQASYNLLDPFYRARVDFLGHLQNQGRISYTLAEFAKATIQGNIAKVQFHVIADVPSFSSTVTGETIQVPPKNMILPTTWLWIDNNWYMEFYSEARELRYTRY